MHQAHDHAAMIAANNAVLIGNTNPARQMTNTTGCAARIQSARTYCSEAPACFAGVAQLASRN